MLTRSGPSLPKLQSNGEAAAMRAGRPADRDALRQVAAAEPVADSPSCNRALEDRQTSAMSWGQTLEAIACLLVNVAGHVLPTA
jgi:hypothetical protein